MAAEPDRIKSTFLAALDRDTPADRAAFLDEACAADAALRERVDALLQAHDRSSRLLDQPAAEHLAIEEAEKTEIPNQSGGDGVPLDFLSPSTKPGALGRLGHYDVLEVLGRGGMGVVLRAFDEKLHRVVAVKVLAPALASNSSARQRFVREAQAAAAVTHENVIAIHAVEDDGPVPYLVMQCIDGKTLQQKLDTIGPLELRTILRIALQIAEGLSAAHHQGLIHRDIKPANILLENGIERVKITDFGLARAADDASLTQSGYVAGTPMYMSPEQARGERVDYRTDLFSLGTVLYTLCAGHPPFRAENSMAVLKRVCEDTPRPLREINPDIPEWLQALIAKLHAKNPTERFAAAAEVAALLSRRLAQLQSGAAPSVTAVPAMAAPRRRGPKWLAALGRRVPLRWAALALVVIGAAGASWLLATNWGANPKTANDDDAGAQPAPAPPVDITRTGARPAPAPPVVISRSRQLRKHSAGLRAVAFSPDGKVLASGGMDGSIFLWDTRTWQARGPLWEGLTGEVFALAFSPKDGQLASVIKSPDTCLVRLWNVKTAQAAGTAGTPGPGDLGMLSVAFSPDGRTVACAGMGRKLYLLDVATGTERLAIPDVDHNNVPTVSFSSPDGRQVATGGEGPAHLWDTTTGKEVPTELPLPKEMYAVFLPDGKGLVGWHWRTCRITLCDLPSGKVRHTWQAHPERMAGLAVSPDGRFLASVGQEGVAKIWSAEDYREVATLIGHEGMIYSASFSPDGKRLATGGKDDSTVRIWDLPAICQVRK